MIAKISGKIAKIKENFVIIDTESGIGYKVFVNQIDLFMLNNNKGNKNSLFIHHEIKENEQNLYGFSQECDQDFFEILIEINGIGCKTVLGIMSHINPVDFITAIENKDLDVLSKLPKIGKKTAEKILVECSNKMNKFNHILSFNNVININVIQEAVDALKGIGYNTTVEDLKKIYIDNMNTEELIKHYISKRQ